MQHSLGLTPTAPGGNRLDRGFLICFLSFVRRTSVVVVVVVAVVVAAKVHRAAWLEVRFKDPVGAAATGVGVVDDCSSGA